MVWDSELTEQFGLISEYSLLKEYEVDRMFPLKPARLPKSSVQHVIFIVRPVLVLMDYIATNIKKEEEDDGFATKEYHIFFVPWKSFLCIQKLEVIIILISFMLVSYLLLLDCATYSSALVSRLLLLVYIM